MTREMENELTPEERALKSAQHSMRSPEPASRAGSSKNALSELSVTGGCSRLLQAAGCIEGFRCSPRASRRRWHCS
jgi:hypothetical protein